MGCVPLPKAEAGEGDRTEVLKLGTLHCLEPKSPVSLTCELRAQLSLTSPCLYICTHVRSQMQGGRWEQRDRENETNTGEVRESSSMVSLGIVRLVALVLLVVFSSSLHQQAGVGESTSCYMALFIHLLHIKCCCYYVSLSSFTAVTSSIWMLTV